MQIAQPGVIDNGDGCGYKDWVSEVIINEGGICEPKNGLDGSNEWLP